MPRTHVYYVAPTGRGVGLTSTCLGLVRALDRVGRRVGFYKPIQQPGAEDGPERSNVFVRAASDIDPPEPVGFRYAARLLREGRRGQLLEEIVERFQRAAEGTEVVVVEGLDANVDEPGMGDLNADIVTALDAEVILATAMQDGDDRYRDFADRLESTGALYGGLQGAYVLGCVVNRLNEPEEVAGASRTARAMPVDPIGADDILREVDLFGETFHLLGAVPWRQQMVSPRTRDVRDHLDARVLNEGEMERRRVVDLSLCARTVANMTHRLRPDALIITPGDRDDVVLATCMAALNGVPIAGLVLTGGTEPDGRIAALCERAFETGLPVMVVDTDSYVTAAHAAAMPAEVPVDDLERIEFVMDTVASHLDVEWLTSRLATELEPRLSPPAFRYALVERARRAGKRIVLPEGDEPRTIQAAVRCAERGIARCILLGNEDAIRRAAEAQGVELPSGIEVLDPVAERERYVAPMLELRAHRGLTEPVARDALEDNVVLGTMMLARGEVDGLVSGAVHTTANTVRPALQLIKTKADAKLVSSIFFMLLPEQVLIYGDCAINPDPNAEELADIALQSAASAEAFGIPPRVAMISYSTGSSGEGSDVDKVREATQLARAARPDLLIDGPLQYDAASIASVAKSKAPDSEVAGRATVFIFPDLNTGNTTYKAVQRSANVVSIGPMLQGLRRPVNDLSRGALVEDIVYTIALTAIQAAQVEADEDASARAGAAEASA